MEGGGAQKAVLLLMNELCKRGWRVSLLLSKPEGPFLKRIDKKVKIIRLKKKKISSNIFEISKYLRHDNPTIFYSSMTYVNVIAGLAVRISGFKKQVVFSEHSNLSARNTNNPNFINKVITFLTKIVYKRANAVVCVSEGVKDDFRKVFPYLRATVVIYNPIENLFMDL